METGSINSESKVASGNEPVLSSSGQEEAAPAAAGGGEEVAMSPPAPVASPKPYYECVFCKRGFTTAQALGGHMNIHRRHRPKPTRESPASSITTVSRNVECYNKYRHMVSYPSTRSTPMAIGSSSSSSSNLGMCYPSTGIAAAVDTEGVSPSSVSPRELTLFGAATGDHDLHLGLVCHGDAGDGPHMPPEGSERQTGEPERELDLELRLGRRPRD